MIAFAVLAFVGVTWMGPGQVNVVVYSAGDTIFRVSLVLFTLEYLLSFFR